MSTESTRVPSSHGVVLSFAKWRGYILRMPRPSSLAILALSLLGLLGASAVHAKGRPIKLNVHAGHVKKGTEKQTCFPVIFPRRQAVDVDHVQIYVHGGS